MSSYITKKIRRFQIGLLIANLTFKLGSNRYVSRFLENILCLEF